MEKNIKNYSILCFSVLLFSNVAIAKDDLKIPESKDSKVPYIALEEEKSSGDINLMDKIKNAVNNLAFVKKSNKEIKEKIEKKKEEDTKVIDFKEVKDKDSSKEDLQNNTEANLDEPESYVKKDESVVIEGTKDKDLIKNAASQLEELSDIDIEQEQVVLESKPSKKEVKEEKKKVSKDNLINTRTIKSTADIDTIIESPKEKVIVEIDEANQEPVDKPVIPEVGVIDSKEEIKALSDDDSVTLEDMKKGFSSKSFDGLIPDLSSGDDLKNLLEDKKDSVEGFEKSNAAVFDISGIMLRMNIFQVEEILKKLGYKKVMQKMEIPNFIKWRNEEKCRNNGVVGYERLAACVVKLSKAEDQQYIEAAKYQRFETKEEIMINLTSNFTKNKIYKITYKSMIPAITGNSNKSQYLRNIKIHEFWRRINQKYGAPDNKQTVSWGLGGNKPYMKASTGFLMLEDPMLKELDYTRMSREDQKYMKTDLYSF